MPQHRVDVAGHAVPTDHWIGGEWVPSVSQPATFDDISPIDESVIGQVARGGPAEADAAKYFAAEAAFRACETAVLTHGGMGYAKEYHVERYLREAMLPRIAPVSMQMVFSFIAEKVLGLPKSY